MPEENTFESVYRPVTQVTNKNKSRRKITSKISNIDLHNLIMLSPAKSKETAE